MKAYCNRHFATYEVALGCEDCNALQSTTVKDDQILTNDELFFLTSLGFSVREILSSSDEMKQDFKRLISKMIMTDDAIANTIASATSCMTGDDIDLEFD